MLRMVVFTAALTLPAAALACGGDKTTTASADKVEANTAHADGANPAACAKKADLVGSGCSYTTGMMAQRVMAEGGAYSFAGSLVSAGAELASHVAAPYIVGPDGTRVVANEVLEDITEAGLTEGRVNLEGKMLEVDGVRYFVVTGFQALNA